MIEVRIEGGVREVALSRVEKRNALTPEMLEALTEAVQGCRESVLLLRGKGPTFCAGFDLTLCRDDGAVLPRLLTGLSHAIRALRASEAVVVVAVQGAAIAGGCALLGGADFVVTHAGAKLGYGAVRLGISPAVSGPSLVDLVGDRGARELLLEPRVVTGRDALRLGLVAECVEDAEAAEALGRALAMELAGKPRMALSRTKAWLNEIADAGRGDAYDVALNVSLGLVDGEEGRRMLAQVWTASS